jgi:hypothetical protein
MQRWPYFGWFCFVLAVLGVFLCFICCFCKKIGWLPIYLAALTSASQNMANVAFSCTSYLHQWTIPYDKFACKT